jgi:adenylate cyclase
MLRPVEGVCGGKVLDIRIKWTNKLKWVAGISIVCPLFVLLLYVAGVFVPLEWQAFDHFMKSNRSQNQAHPDVAIILIDEASLQAMNPIVGRWPWPRSVYPEVLEFMDMGGAAAVAFDIMFSENESVPVGCAATDNDMLFAEATAMSGNVIHAQQILRDSADEGNEDLLGKDMPAGFSESFSVSGYSDDFDEGSNNFYLPIESLRDAAASIGVVEFKNDPDGVFRRSKPLRRYKDDFYPVLGLAPVMLKMGINEIERTSKGISLGEIEIPIWPDGKYLINMYGKYNTYSISGILASMQKLRRGETDSLLVDPFEFEDKIVFIGASAVGVEDLKHTSVQQAMPGVMLHASLASNILGSDFLSPPSPAVTVLFIILLSASTAFCVLMSRDNLIKAGVPAALLVFFYILVDSGFGANRIYELTPPVTGLVLSFVAAFVYLSATEGRERRRVRKMLGQYVSPHMLSSLVDNREGLLKAEVGSKEMVTILFSDIRGFTSISENEPPERIVSMLNRYFTLWSDAIFRYDGTIDKFVGDAVMALWGAPLITDDHAEQAVRAALHLLEALPELNRELGAEGYPELRVGIGIHTGHAILGNIGSERKLDYTVIGDTVNLSSRIEGLTKQYACDILITEATYQAVKDLFRCSFTDTVKVKGKEEAVKVYMVEGGREDG